MFYDNKLMNSGSLGKVWRAGNSIHYESDEEISMPKICDKLDSWVSSEQEDARLRLSLRTSAVFVDGAARMYKRKVQHLFNDIESLDKEMAFPRRARYLTNMRNDSYVSNHDTISKSTSSEETEVTHRSICYNGSENVEMQEINESSNSMVVDESTNLEVDKEVQTSMEDIGSGGLNPNLPFGYVLIHDNIHSRIPTRIIISSINPDVVDLPEIV